MERRFKAGQDVRIVVAGDSPRHHTYDGCIGQIQSIDSPDKAANIWVYFSPERNQSITKGSRDRPEVMSFPSVCLREAKERKS